MKTNFSYEEIKLLLEATYRIIDSGKNAEDPNNISTEIQFINMFIETLVTRTLNRKPVPNKSKKDQFNELKVSFAKLKLCIQEAVALGFQEPMQKFSKHSIEYYCIINPAHDTNNKVTH